MLERKLAAMVLLACGSLGVAACGGGGDNPSDDSNPLVCIAPFVPNTGSTACVCPSGTHAEGITCAADGVADTTPPIVAITSPANSATLSGSLSVVASASDNVAIADVSLEVDGVAQGDTFTESPAGTFTATFVSNRLSNGPHTIRVCAIDTSANTGCSSTVTVSVGNSADDVTPPAIAITSPADGATVSGTVNVLASISDPSGVGVTSLYVAGNNTGGLGPNGSGTYSASYGTSYICYGPLTLEVCAYDLLGNYGCSGVLTVTVVNCPDESPPTVWITAPTGGATVSGTFEVKARASDDRRIASVNLVLDGGQSAATFIEGPAEIFTASVDSASLTNGNHSLQVCAADGSNTRCSSETTVTVSNAPPP